jgi:hypothetical protein
MRMERSWWVSMWSLKGRIREREGNLIERSGVCGDACCWAGERGRTGLLREPRRSVLYYEELSYPSFRNQDLKALKSLALILSLIKTCM